MADDKRLDTMSELARFQQQLDDMKEELKRARKRGRQHLWLMVLVVCMASMGTVTAQPVISSLHIFTAGEPAHAYKVNENFAFLQNWIETKVGAANSLNVNMNGALQVEGGITQNCPTNATAAGERHGFWVDGPTTNPLFVGQESRAAGSNEWDSVIEWSETANDRLRFRARANSADVMTLYPNGNVTVRGEVNGYAGRRTYSASTQGNTTDIPEADVIRFCGDVDGCRVIIAMYNWDGNRRTASRTDHFFYDANTRRWRDRNGDSQGTNSAGGVQHVEAAWSCYFTDASYSNGRGSDNNGNFGILNWNQFSGETCHLTLID